MSMGMNELISVNKHLDDGRTWINQCIGYTEYASLFKTTLAKDRKSDFVIIN